MSPSARQAVACVLLIFIAAICAQSQVAPAPAKSATISGKVTLKNKGLAGIVVAARYSDPSGYDRSRRRATTDQTGNYRITDLPPGTYQIAPLSPGLVMEDVLFQRSLVIDEGDNLEDVNFSMSRGGVITGKITDADGRPVVEEQVFLSPLDGPYAQSPYYSGGIITDDRGVYRAFGLRAGKYKVYVGQGDNRLPGMVRMYRQTFYPSVIDQAKATIVEVTEGSETADIDIVIGRPLVAFKVSGRIVDGETGKPVPNVRYGIHQRSSDGSGQSTSGISSNANGEFRFEGVRPGTYSVFIAPEQDTELRSDPVPFEVIDRDVTGLLVKTIKAASVSGVVVLEGGEDPAALVKIESLYVHATSEHREGMQGGFPGRVGPDGSFRIIGMSPGVIHFAINTFNSGGTKQLALVRIERDGIIQTSGVNVKDGEQITGLRLIVKTLTASIRGQVKFEDGELPAGVRMSIWLQPVQESGVSYRVMSMNSSPQIDARGRFLIEGIAGGTYEIFVAVFEPARYDTSQVFKQQVTVTDNTVNEVTMTIKLKP